MKENEVAKIVVDVAFQMHTESTQTDNGGQRLAAHESCSLRERSV